MGQIVNQQGMHSVSFLMKRDHFEILEAIARQRNVTPDDIAQDILRGWMTSTWTEIKQGLLKDNVSKASVPEHGL